MPSVSKAQQKFMGMVHAAQKGDLENPSPEVEKAADSMTDKAAKDFASTKHKGLPAHVKKENKIDLEDEDLPSAVVPGVSVENTMKGYDASCGCFRTESADVNQNAVMASIEDLPNNRTQKNFPLPTNRVLWNATGKVCEGRPVVERIKMYEKKGGGWREGVKGDEQVFNSLKELYYERKQVEEIKESVRAILKKKVQTESKLNEDISDIVMNGLQMIGIAASGFFLRFLFRYMIGEFLKASKDTTMNGMKSIIQGVKNAWSSLKNMSRIRQLEKEFENDEDIKHAVSHPRTVDFAKVLKKKLDPKDYDLISKITRNNFR
jgi:hypothetical protein